MEPTVMIQSALGAARKFVTALLVEPTYTLRVWHVNGERIVACEVPLLLMAKAIEVTSRQKTAFRPGKGNFEYTDFKVPQKMIDRVKRKIELSGCQYTVIGG